MQWNLFSGNGQAPSKPDHAEGPSAVKLCPAFRTVRDLAIPRANY
ncbi:hypothetical protein SALBM311S_10722 [Streptomyces alboniger]